MGESSYFVAQPNHFLVLSYLVAYKPGWDARANNFGKGTVPMEFGKKMVPY